MRDNLHGVSSMNHIHNVMIAGGGKTALFLAKMLTAANINVKIIENDRKRAEYLAVGLNRATIVYRDATDSDLLFEEELDNMDAFVACTGFDEENFMLAMYAKQHGLTNAIAKMTRRSYDQMLERIGDVMTINTVELCTASVLRSIKEDNNIVFANMIQGQAEFLELRVDENVNIAGKTLMQLSIPNGILVAAVFRDGELIVPRGSTKFEKNDRILVLSLLSMIGEVQNVFKTRLSKEF